MPLLGVPCGGGVEVWLDSSSLALAVPTPPVLSPSAAKVLPRLHPEDTIRPGGHSMSTTVFQMRIPMPETVVHFQIRMPPALHEQLASWAKEDKASLNALIVGILEKAIEQHSKSGPKEKTLSS